MSSRNDSLFYDHWSNAYVQFLRKSALLIFFGVSLTPQLEHKAHQNIKLSLGNVSG